MTFGTFITIMFLRPVAAIMATMMALEALPPIVIPPNETDIFQWLRTFPAIDKNYSLLPSYVTPTIDREVL
jgi:hypothetical protein